MILSVGFSKAVALLGLFLKEVAANDGSSYCTHADFVRNDALKPCTLSNAESCCGAKQFLRKFSALKEEKEEEDGTNQGNVAGKTACIPSIANDHLSKYMCKDLKIPTVIDEYGNWALDGNIGPSYSIRFNVDISKDEFDDMSLSINGSKSPLLRLETCKPCFMKILIIRERVISYLENSAFTSHIFNNDLIKDKFLLSSHAIIKDVVAFTNTHAPVEGSPDRTRGILLVKSTKANSSDSILELPFEIGNILSENARTSLFTAFIGTPFIPDSEVYVVAVDPNTKSICTIDPHPFRDSEYSIMRVEYIPLADISLVDNAFDRQGLFSYKQLLDYFDCLSALLNDNARPSNKTSHLSSSPSTDILTNWWSEPSTNKPKEALESKFSFSRYKLWIIIAGSIIFIMLAILFYIIFLGHRKR